MQYLVKQIVAEWVSMHNNEYLYGKDVEIPQLDTNVIMRRIELLSNNLSELLEHSYYTRDTRRVDAVLKAMKYWQDMIVENR